MKAFTLGDVLSVTTGKLLSEKGMDGVYEILNYMTGEELFTHQLPRALNVCAPVLKNAYPAIVDENPEIKSKEDLDSWLAGAIQRLGNSFIVPVLEKGIYQPMNPIDEAQVIKSAKH